MKPAPGAGFTKPRALLKLDFLTSAYNKCMALVRKSSFSKAQELREKMITKSDSPRYKIINLQICACTKYADNNNYTAISTGRFLTICCSAVFSCSLSPVVLRGCSLLEDSTTGSGG